MSYPNTHGRLRGPVTVSLLAAAVAVVVVALVVSATVGAGEARAVAVAGVVVATFFGVGLVIMSAALKFHPRAALVLALMTYVLQMALVTLAFVAMDRSGVLAESVDATWLTVGVAVLTVLVTAGLMWWATHVRVPIYDLDIPPSSEGRSGTPRNAGSAPVVGTSAGREASAS